MKEKTLVLRRTTTTDNTNSRSRQRRALWFSGSSGGAVGEGGTVIPPASSTTATTATTTQRMTMSNMVVSTVTVLTCLCLVVVLHQVVSLWQFNDTEQGLYSYVYSSMATQQQQQQQQQHSTQPSSSSALRASKNHRNFVIIVLGMNRFASMERLLHSLQKSEYGHHTVDIILCFDRPNDASTSIRTWYQQVEALHSALANTWKHGTVSMTVANESMGLRQAWLQAWNPILSIDNNNNSTTTQHDQTQQPSPPRFIIFEDDIEVSPLWYQWIQGAHDAYETRSDLAGISLQRQTLVPLKSAANNKIPDNNGQPFLYRLVGSIGYSPKASAWRDFVDFAECALATDLDVSVPGLITSDWYNQLNKRTMWTQLFIYFCHHQQLSTLYMFPPHNLALAAHWREKGEHHGATQGRDFDLLELQRPTNMNNSSSSKTSTNTLTKIDDSSFTFQYPSHLVSLGWDAKPLKSQSVRSLVMSVAMGYRRPEFERFVLGLRKYYQGSIALLISSTASQDIKDLLRTNHVTFVETSERGGPRASLAWNRIIKSRYNFYQATCTVDMYDLCMMVDFRDVLFQADPFQHMTVPTRPTLHLYLHNILVNRWTLTEVAKCSGADPAWIKGQWLINAGGIIASPSVIANISNINKVFGPACDDQVALNLAVYGNKLDEITETIIHKQGTGSINNAAWGGEFRTDSQQRILNHNCLPSPVVHQFDVIESTRQASKQG
jgi:hypothetical protein